MDDRELSRLFDEARREDEGRAPRFSDLLARPPRRGSPAPRRRLVPAMAALLLLVLALVIVRAREPKTLPPSPAAEAFLSQPRWEAPTDFLLKPPAGELLSTTPPIGSSLPALDDGSPEPKKGTRT